MPASPNPRWWDGYDDPYGPAASQPQPSHPIPAFGAPHIAPPTIKEKPMPTTGDHNLNGGYGHQPLPQPPAQPK